jgi:hypothetical protein
VNEQCGEHCVIASESARMMSPPEHLCCCNQQEHRKLTRARKFVRCVFPVPLEIQNLMCAPKATVVFRFTDPTEALARLLVCSPLAADPNNLAFFPEPSDVLEDYCHGARMERIHSAVPEGTAALTAVLFFDELNQDQKGFCTSEGAIIVGGFFRKAARESTYAKTSLGSFPAVEFPRASKTLQCVTRFQKDLRSHQIEAIKNCFKTYNDKGGAIIPLQNGKAMYFPRAAVLAIYADQPAAVKCSYTGSACPQCFTAKPDFARPPPDGIFEMRTVENMKAKKRVYEAELLTQATAKERYFPHMQCLQRCCPKCTYEMFEMYNFLKEFIPLV